MSDLKKIRDEFILKLKNNLDFSEINQIKSDLLGKNGLISSQFKKIGTLVELERKKFASDLIWFISERSKSLFNLKVNSSLIFFRSDISTDYFLSKIKQ